MKINWTLEPSIATLLDPLKGLGVTNFIIPHSKLFLRQELQHSLRMLSLGGEIRLETLYLKMRIFFDSYYYS